MKRRTFLSTGLSGAVWAAMPDLRLFGGEAPPAIWDFFLNPDDPYYSSVPPPGYEIPGKTVQYTFPSWQSDATVRQRASSIVGMMRQNGVDFVLKHMLAAAVEARLGDLLPMVSARITPGQTGYLLRVNFIREPSGRLYPAPNLITGIGLGTEPLDALAEFFLQPSIGPTQMLGMREHHYRWCTRTGDTLTASCVPVEVGVYLETRAQAEALRLRTLGGTPAERQADAIRRLERGREYMATWERRRAEISGQYDRARLDALVRSFQASEQRFNAAYSDYQLAERKAAEHAREAAMLSGISGLLSAANTALQLRGQLRGESATSPDEQARWQAHQEGVLRGAAETSRAEMAAGWPNLERLDTRLRTEWARMGEAPLPPIIPPILF